MSGSTLDAPRTCAVEGCGVVLGEGIASLYCAVHRSRFEGRPEGNHCAMSGCSDARAFGAIYCVRHLSWPVAGPRAHARHAARLAAIAAELEAIGAEIEGDS